MGMERFSKPYYTIKKFRNCLTEQKRRETKHLQVVTLSLKKEKCQKMKNRFQRRDLKDRFWKKILEKTFFERVGMEDEWSRTDFFTTFTRKIKWTPNIGRRQRRRRQQRQLWQRRQRLSRQHFCFHSKKSPKNVTKLKKIFLQWVFFVQPNGRVWPGSWEEGINTYFSSALSFVYAQHAHSVRALGIIRTESVCVCLCVCLCEWVIKSMCVRVMKSEREWEWEWESWRQPCANKQTHGGAFLSEQSRCKKLNNF